MVTPGSQAEEVGRLILAGFIVMALPALPFGNYLVYPFTIVTTWFHEMGHGLAAQLLGQDFVRLQIFADGSGVAESRIASDASRLLRAGIAAGGPLGPIFVGSALILASAHPKLWRPALWGLSAALFASVILYVRSSTGFAVLPLIALTLALIAWKAAPGFNRFALQFLGVLGAMSMLNDCRYFFTEEVVIGGRSMLSDTGQIEAALLLPHWVWAILILLTSAIMVGASLKYALSEKRRLALQPKRPANVLQFRRLTDRDR
ncbi:M50 family metallopeptidase [Erythrobacter sp. SCSIO 43205]|uniref:M50 family metallopeptidase n=1 Tax=Erythrobacter sp. SCSIO 43205 TaxID=2779361 RepID=UPI0021027A64|nr:M50 family metallopeptidase [Erythrobacter sp. SCSIO 43205]